MIKRGPTHVTDTLAVRTVLSAIPGDWLVRSLEERDYGIDLTIEIFKDNSATGKIALIQVKGTNTSFANKDSISFPVKTLEYALLFAEPFFLFHTSISDKSTRFVWLQKYATSRLNSQIPKWRSQEHVSIHFPKENTLKGGRGKIEKIMERYAARSQAFEYLSAIDWLEMHWSAVSCGEKGLLESCILNLEKMRRCKDFLDVYAEMPMRRPDFARAEKCLQTLAKKKQPLTSKSVAVAKLKHAFENCLLEMQLLKKSFLDENELDEFLSEGGAPVY